MSFEPEFEKIILCEKKGVLEQKEKVDCKTQISTESIKKIIFVTAHPYVSKVESIDGGVEYAGKVNFFVCYEDQQEQIRKYECASEYSGVIKDGSVMPSSKTKAIVTVQKTEANGEGINLSLTANLSVQVEIREKAEKSFVSGGKGFYCDKKEVEILKSLGERTIVYPFEEEFELGFAVKDVLSQGASCIITACQCGVGTIIVDGEVYLSAILLQGDDGKDIIKETRALPFRAEIECEDAMPTNTAVAYATQKSFKTDITVDEEQKKSVVTVNLLINLSGEAYSNEKVGIIDDAFSINEEIELITEKSINREVKEQETVIERGSSRASIEELPVGAGLIATINERAETVSQTVTEKGIEITGVVSCTAIMKDGEGKTFSRKVETPFTATLSAKNCLDCVETNVSVKSLEAKIISLDSAELSYELICSINQVKNCEVNLVKEIKSICEKKPCDSAISVYIPLEGETLFPLAKRLNVNPSELVTTNKELEFPLTGEERIVIYRQK